MRAIALSHARARAVASTWVHRASGRQLAAGGSGERRKLAIIMASALERALDSATRCSKLFIAANFCASASTRRFLFAPSTRPSGRGIFFFFASRGCASRVAAARGARARAQKLAMMLGDCWLVASVRISSSAASLVAVVCDVVFVLCDAARRVVARRVVARRIVARRVVGPISRIVVVVMFRRSTMLADKPTRTVGAACWARAVGRRRAAMQRRARIWRAKWRRKLRCGCGRRLESSLCWRWAAATCCSPPSAVAFLAAASIEAVGNLLVAPTISAAVSQYRRADNLAITSDSKRLADRRLSTRAFALPLECSSSG